VNVYKDDVWTTIKVILGKNWVKNLAELEDIQQKHMTGCYANVKDCMN
jgi:hypothetical protein